MKDKKEYSEITKYVMKKFDYYLVRLDDDELFMNILNDLMKYDCFVQSEPEWMPTDEEIEQPDVPDGTSERGEKKLGIKNYNGRIRR